VLFLFGFVLPLLLLIGIFAVVDDLGDRRVRRGGDQNQIQIQLLGAADGYRRG
jgi:hypothetical protein